MPVYFWDEMEFILLSTLSEFTWWVWGSPQPVCAFVCFDAVKDTTAWNNNILLLKVVHFVHTIEYPQVMGDVSLGGNLPLPGSWKACSLCVDFYHFVDWRLLWSRKRCQWHSMFLRCPCTCTSAPLKGLFYGSFLFTLGLLQLLSYGRHSSILC